MSIPSGGLAALLVVAALGLGACGGSDSSVTTTTTVSPGAGTETATQTVAGQTSTAKTTTQSTTTTSNTQTTTSKPTQTTTQKTQTTTSKPKPAASSAPCPSVDVGVRSGDVDSTFARVTSVSKVDCDMVTYVVQQWGGQRIGGEKALLPLGWSCSGNACRKGGSSVSFVLVPPSNSD